MAVQLSEKLRQKTYIFSLGTILLLIVLNIVFIVSLKLQEASTQKEQELLKSALTIKNNMLVNLNSLDMSIRGYLLTGNPAFKETYFTMKKVQEDDFYTLDSLLSSLSYHPNGYGEIKDAVLDYFDLMGSLIEMKDDGMEKAAIEIINEDKGTEVWMQYVEFSEAYDVFIKGEENGIISTREALIFINVSLEVILGLLGVPIIIFIIYLLKTTAKKNKVLLEKLIEQNNALLFKSDRGDVTDNETIITTLVENIKSASEFVRKLTEGNYKVTWKDFDEAADKNKHTLSGQLIGLRDKLHQVDLERQERIWFNEGINQLSETVRKYQDDFTQFYDQILIFTIKYLGVNQGGLFIYNEERRLLQLKAAYAFDRKKFLEKEIKIGEGLVGQTYLEKAPVHVRNLSEEYTYIQSGLGDAKPVDIYIFPLINNGEVIGIMELASFDQFKEKEVKFLEKLAEIVASSLYVQMNNEKTKFLLEKSQEQAEELRAQEEEMRQNTEELQATQEEMSRHKLSLEEEISELKKKLLEKEGA